MEPLYRFVTVLVKAFMRLMGWRLHVIAGERIPRAGAAVLACNHISYWDPVLLAYAAERRGRAVRFLAKAELFDKPGFGWLLRRLKQIPVDREGRPDRSIESSVRMLETGELVGMFPEATISTSFVPKEAKTGAVRMALAAGVPLVPVAVWGGQRFVTKHRAVNWQRRLALMVHVGEPLALEPDEDPHDVLKRLMTVLSDLADDLARTYPQHPAGREDRWWLPAHLGGTAPTPKEAEAARRERRPPRPPSET